MSKIAVLISGRGSNLAAMCNNGLSKKITCVISNKADALGLDIAKKFNIPTYIIDHKIYPTREEFDQKMAKIIDNHDTKYIILAGFMRILSPWFVDYYQNRLVNIHPSLLPSFIGANAIENAFINKVKISGVTIHFVTQQLDQGPIIAQGIVPLESKTSISEFNNAIHQIEHVIYPFIIYKLIENKITITQDMQVVVEKQNSDETFLGQFKNHIFY